MRRAFVAVTLLLAVGGAYAAGAFGGSPSLRTDIRLTRHFACVDANRHRVDRRTLRRFRAVSAVYCSEGQRVYPGQGQWEVLVRKVAVSSVSGLQRYYEQPDERNFVRGFRLDASRTRRLLRALAGPGPKRGCPKQRTFAVVIKGPGSVASVELGGCYRVDRGDRLAGTAKPAVVRGLLGG